MMVRITIIRIAVSFCAISLLAQIASSISEEKIDAFSKIPSLQSATLKRLDIATKFRGLVDQSHEVILRDISPNGQFIQIAISDLHHLVWRLGVLNLTSLEYYPIQPPDGAKMPEKHPIDIAIHAGPWDIKNQDYLYVNYSPQNGNDQIWKMKFDGSNSHLVSNTEESIIAQSITPDGKYLLANIAKKDADGNEYSDYSYLDINSNYKLVPIDFPQELETSAYFSPNNETILTSPLINKSGCGNYLRLYDKHTQLYAPIYSSHQEQLRSPQKEFAYIQKYFWLPDSSGVIMSVKNKLTPELWWVTTDGQDLLISTDDIRLISDSSNGKFLLLAIKGQYSLLSVI